MFAYYEKLSSKTGRTLPTSQVAFFEEQITMSPNPYFLSEYLERLLKNMLTISKKKELACIIFHLYNLYLRQH